MWRQLDRASVHFLNDVQNYLDAWPSRFPGLITMVFCFGIMEKIWYRYPSDNRSN